MITFHNKHTNHFNKRFSDIWEIANDENNTHEEAWTVFADDHVAFLTIILNFYKNHLVLRRLRDKPDRTASDTQLLQRIYRAILYCEETINIPEKILQRNDEIFSYPKDETDWNFGIMDSLHIFHASINSQNEDLQVGHAWMIYQMLISLSYAIILDEDSYTPMRFIEEYEYNIQTLISAMG